MTYTIRFATASWRPSFKTFVLANKVFANNERILIKKSHPMRQMSTRKIIPGVHELSVACHGKVLVEARFEVKE
jgi:hypothetical protein